MIKVLGSVMEVFIPKQYKNGSLLDVMDRTNIGFKIITCDGIRKIELEQDGHNVQIMKNDIVVITEQTIADKKNADIKLYDGEENE